MLSDVLCRPSLPGLAPTGSGVALFHSVVQQLRRVQLGPVKWQEEPDPAIIEERTRQWCHRVKQNVYRREPRAISRARPPCLRASRGRGEHSPATGQSRQYGGGRRQRSRQAARPYDRLDLGDRYRCRSFSPRGFFNMVIRRSTCQNIDGNILCGRAWLVRFRRPGDLASTRRAMRCSSSAPIAVGTHLVHMLAASTQCW